MKRRLIEALGPSLLAFLTGMLWWSKWSLFCGAAVFAWCWFQDRTRTHDLTRVIALLQQLGTEKPDETVATL